MDPQTAQDLWPLVQKLPREERLRLAQLALRSATLGDDAAGYVNAPVGIQEFATDEDPLAWEAEGWDESSRNAYHSRRSRRLFTPDTCQSPAH